MSSESNSTRNRILETTIELLKSSRGREVRMADIARGAGVSRQAVYLHFGSRAELLIAATRHVDDLLDLESRLAPSRDAVDGAERLALYVTFWAGYLPKVYRVASALIAVRDTDRAAAQAWAAREAALREGCAAVVDQLIADKRLAPLWSRDVAIDVFWSQLSVSNWERLTVDCSWTQKQYARRLTNMLLSLLVRDADLA